MSAEEVRAFLAEQMVMQCATNGPRGLPHMVALWFVAGGGELRGWTYAKSQKARNLERDPRATLGLEDGSIVVEWAFKGEGYLVKEVLKEAGDAVVLEPPDAREAVLAAAERLLVA